MSISSDEVNYLVYRYLQESGFVHSSFTFGYESNVRNSDIDREFAASSSNVFNLPPAAEVAPGSLISFLQKGLQYLQIETEIRADGSIARTSDQITLLQLKKARGLIEQRNREESTEETEPTKEKEPITSEPAEKKTPEPEVEEEPMHVEVDQSAIIDQSRITKLSGHTGEVFMCDFHPKRNLIVTGCSDMTARIWNLDDVVNFELSKAIVIDHSGAPQAKSDVTVVEWNQDGSMLGTASYDGVVRIWDSNGKEIHSMREHQGPIFSLRWNRRGDCVLSGSVDKKTIVWDAKSGTPKQEFNFHKDGILDVDWRNNNSFASCSVDGSIFICKLGEDAPLKMFKGHKDEVNVVRWDPAGRLLASCSDDRTARVWSLQEDDSILELDGHRREIYTLRWKPKNLDGSDGRSEILATASVDKTVKLWDVNKGGKPILDLSRHKEPIYAINFSPCGSYLASGSFDKSVIIWSVKDGSVVRTFDCMSSIYDVSWNKEGNKLAACCSGNMVNIIDFRM